MKAAQAPASSAGMMSERIESPAINALRGSTPLRSKIPEKVSGFLSLTISMPLEQVAQARRCQLGLLVEQVALGHQHQAGPLG